MELKDFKLPDEFVTPLPPNGVIEAKSVTKDKFVNAMPLWWIEAIYAHGSAALFVGIALWHFYGFTRKNGFRAGIKDLTLDTVSESTVKRGLADLTKAGLVSRKAKPGSKNTFYLCHQKIAS